MAESAEATASDVAKVMSSWQIHEYGGVDKLKLAHDVEVPVVKKPDDVLVEVHAASVSPIDVKNMDGYASTAFGWISRVKDWDKRSFPVSLGKDFSGVVVQTGQGVTHVKPGDEVWGNTAAWSRNGSHQQFTIVPAGWMSKKPSSISHVEAASFPHNAMTTWGALNPAPEGVKDKRVFVYGGSGGIGTFAIQVLHAYGAEVTTSCGTDAIELCKKLGADTVIDYKTSNVEEELQKIQGFDIILDTLGNTTASFNRGLLAPSKGALYVTLVNQMMYNFDTYGMLAGGLKSAVHVAWQAMAGVMQQKKYKWGFSSPSTASLETVANMVDNKQIVPFIHKVFPFEEAPAAYEMVKSGHLRGKVVIEVKPSQTL